MSSVIRLSIKAANGSVSDFSVEAESSWTFRQLKNHLYRHYPTHPPLASQKLIHSGKLLEDTQTLATLATSLSSDIESVIVVHLVAYQRSQSSPAVVSESSTEPVSRQSSLSTVKEDNDAPQQQEASPQPQPAGPPPPPWLRYRGQTSPAMMTLPPQFYLPPYEAAYAQQMALWYQNYYATTTATTVPAAPPLERDAVDAEPLNEGQDGVEVEDDVPVHAAGGAAGLGMMAGGGGGGGRNRRDLVDVVYMLTMFGFLGLVAYLTGSLGRLVVFAGGILFVLLNQGGWFAVRRRRQAAPVAEDVNPLNRPEQVGAAAAGPGGGGGGGGGGGAGGQEQQQEVPPEDTPPTAAPEPPQAQDEQRQGILATLFIFVTSFFTSLIPHQRPELQAN